MPNATSNTPHQIAADLFRIGENPDLPTWHYPVLRRAIELLAHHAYAEQLAVVPIEEMIRFCPECGRLGDIPVGYEACCPDWAQARIVPKRFAELCAETFKLCVSQPYPQAAPAPADERTRRFIPTRQHGRELWQGGVKLAVANSDAIASEIATALNASAPAPADVLEAR